MYTGEMKMGMAEGLWSHYANAAASTSLGGGGSATCCVLFRASLLILLFQFLIPPLKDGCVAT